MVLKKDISTIIEYVVKNYEWKNHESDFTSYSYTTLSGRQVTIKVLELTQKPTFIKKINEAKSTNRDKDKWRVDVPSNEDLEGVRIFQTWNGCTFAIKSDGDIINVCAKKDAKGHSLDNMEAVMNYAVKMGGDRLDSFDGNWAFYRKCGFEPREWIGFDEDFGESIGWVKGRDLPEAVVFMEYTGDKKRLTPSEVKTERNTFYTETKETTMDEAREGEEIAWDVAYRKRNEKMDK